MPRTARRRKPRGRTGPEAVEWAKKTAPRVIKELGASSVEGYTNECELDGQRAIVKCAGSDTDNIMVSFKKIDDPGRLDLVIGAFEQRDGSLDVRSLSADEYRSVMKRYTKKKQGKVLRTYFLEHGLPLRTVTPQ